MNIERIPIRQGVCLLLFLVFSSAGCQPQAVPTAYEPGTDVFVPHTGSTTQATTSVAALVMTAGPVQPSVAAADQEIQAGEILIGEVVSQEPGWLVIYNQEGGGLGRVLGYVQVMPGSTTNLAVKLENQELASGLIYAVLHRDAGEIGVFEFPGLDKPAVIDGNTIWTQFRISTASPSPPQVLSTGSPTAPGTEPAQPVSTENAAAAATESAQAATTESPTVAAVGTTVSTPTPPTVTETPGSAPTPTVITTTNSAPSVIIVDQVIRGGSVSAASVSMPAPGFLTIRNQNLNGSYGAVIGWTAVNPGLSEDVLVNIDVSRGTNTLYAVLHTDTDPIGVYNFPGPDQPLKAEDVVVAQPFKVIEGLLGTNITIKSNGGDPPYLVDSLGMSIYSSSQDRIGVSKCSGECRKSWLPVLAMGRLLPGEGVTIQKFGILVYRNGNRQVTYAGMPLYYYVGDQKPGDTLGEGVDEAWYLAAP
jgi:predicted lipoprotein with Yx(FWY)xxD motif